MTVTRTGNIVSTNPTYTFPVTKNRKLTAIFEAIPTYTITVLVDPTGGGTASGGRVVQQGQSVTLTQTTTDGYRFSGWYSSAGVLLSANSTYTFTPTESAVITAKFSAIPVYTVTATIDPSGSGIVTGAGQYQEGAQATITATPADGYTFSGWTENGATVSTSASYTFTVTGNRSFVAEFEEVVSALTWAGTTAPNPGRASWMGVAYGNGRFVAVSGGNNSGYKTAYSSDGIAWAESTLGNGYKWCGIAYGGGKFAAISGYNGTSNGFAYSDDGISWTAVYPQNYFSRQWMGITYGGGKFVAVANYSPVTAYSTDGINWEKADIPDGDLNTHLDAVAYGGGKFVAIGYSMAVYSDDGINWTKTTIPAFTKQCLEYGNGKFVAIGYNSDKAAYSVDGINWAEFTLPISANWRDLVFGNGMLVLIAGVDSDKVLYSTDGINWAEGSLPVSEYWMCAGYGNNRFVALTSGTTAAYTL